MRVSFQHGSSLVGGRVLGCVILSGSHSIFGELGDSSAPSFPISTFLFIKIYLICTHAHGSQRLKSGVLPQLLLPFWVEAEHLLTELRAQPALGIPSRSPSPTRCFTASHWPPFEDNPTHSSLSLCSVEFTDIKLRHHARILPHLDFCEPRRVICQKHGLGTMDPLP